MHHQRSAYPRTIAIRPDGTTVDAGDLSPAYTGIDDRDLYAAHVMPAVVTALVGQGHSILDAELPMCAAQLSYELADALCAEAKVDRSVSSSVLAALREKAGAR